MTEREALKLALEALEAHADFGIKSDKAITAIKEALAQPENCEYCDGTGDVHSIDGEWRGVCICEAGKALAQPEQEPVGLIESLKDAKPCCGEYETCWRACTPRGKFLGQRDAQRTWVGLTDEEKREAYYKIDSWSECIAFIEAKLKEKNCG